MNELSESSQLISQTGLWLTGLKTLAMLCIVLGLLIVVLLVMKRFLNRRNILGKGQIIKVLSSRQIAPKGRIALITVTGENFLIGITPENITCLGRIGQSGALERLEQAGSDAACNGNGVFGKLLGASLKGTTKSDGQ